jgi:hypothetical protein
MAAEMTQREINVTGVPHVAKVITPNDNQFLLSYSGEVIAQTVYVGVAGTVRVQPYGNPPATPVSFVLLAGQVVPVVCTQVYATGTTASGLVGVY